MPVSSTTASRTDLRTRPGTDLSVGARGEAVKTLQEQLTRAGFAADVDGAFGPQTLQQLKAFQEARGLPVSGRLDTATATALRSGAAPTTATPTTAAPTAPTRAPASGQTVTDARRRAMTSPTGMTLGSGFVPAPTTEQVRAGTHKLKVGMEGPAVQELQQRLNRDGATLEADGRFGPRTEAALKQWQASRDITDTGVVGPTTQRALDDNRPVSRSADTTPPTTGTSRSAAIDATRGMTEAQKFDHYAALARQHGGEVKTGANQKNIVGLRVPTDADVNGGGGRYDDRFAMFWVDGQGNKRVREYSGNTEPSARYRGRMGEDANGDGRLDQGRLPSGFYEFTTGYSSRLGRTLNPIRDYRVERDTNQDGVFGNDGGRMSGGGNSMLFHAGGSSITGSAGCQTMAPDEYARFWRDLNSGGGTNGRVGYTLIEVQ